MSKRNVIVSLLALFALATTTRADLIHNADGPAMPTGSWSQGFFTTFGGGFDFMGMRIVSGGDSFEDPSVTDLGDEGWSIVAANGANPTVLAIAGATQTTVGYVTHFAGAMSDPLVWENAVYQGNTYLGGFRSTWDGSSWTFDFITSWNPGREALEAVPLPAPVALAGLGLLGVVVTRRRFRAA